MIIDTDISADAARANLFEPIIIAEDDENAHRLIARLLVNKEDLSVVQSATPAPVSQVMLNYLRADGVAGTQSGTITDGKVCFNIPNEMLELDDKVKCDISLAYPQTVVIHSVSEGEGEIVVSAETKTVQVVLKTALFYIDSQRRVIIDE